MTHQRVRELGGAGPTPGAPLGALGSALGSTAAAAITMPAVHANKALVGATGITTVVGTSEIFHKTAAASSPDGIRPATDLPHGVLCNGKGLQLGNGGCAERARALVRVRART